MDANSPYSVEGKGYLGKIIARNKGIETHDRRAKISQATLDFDFFPESQLANIEFLRGAAAANQTWSAVTMKHISEKTGRFSDLTWRTI